MKPEELRIGNYLEWKEKPEVPINTVVAITGVYRDNQFGELLVDYQDIEAGGENTIELEYFKPIPLTEEWLAKFGFEVTEEGQVYGRALYLEDRAKDKLSKGINKEDWGCWAGDQGSYLREIKHVHQLQNLYYALTGEELKLKK